MQPWDLLLEPIRLALFLLIHLLGGSAGGGIIALSLIVRLALLPLTLRAAAHAHRTRRTLEAFRPRLDRLRRRWADDPRRLARETLALYRRHGIRPMAGMVPVLFQLPVVAALYAVIRTGAAAGGRFLWIGSLAKPDAALALLVAALSGASVAAVGAGPRGAWAAAAGMTLLLLWRMAAGVGLYWGVSSGVALVQAVFLRRLRARG